MKMRIASLTILCLALAMAAWADYNNGAINGSTDAWTINFGYIVSDTFLTGSNDTTLTGFVFGIWEFPGDQITQVDWSITSGENSGTLYGSGTARTSDKFLSSNQYGYNIDVATVSGLNVAVHANTSYWLNLQNASVANGDPVYWDENSGPSTASESSLGTIPSEAFTVNLSGGITCGVGNNSPDCGPPVPEPGSILLLGSGILGVVGVLRRRLNR